MEVLQVAQQIEKIIQAMADPRQALEERGNKKAEAIRDYDKAVAVAALKLAAGRTEGMELEGEPAKKAACHTNPRHRKGPVLSRAL